MTDSLATNDVPPFDQWAQWFASAVGLAARFELELRVFAEELSQTRAKAFKGLETVAQAPYDVCGTAFDAEDRRTLDAARRIRNKLVHCEFWTVEQLIVEQVGPIGATGSVFTYDDEIGVRTNREMPISEARIYGWLMEGADPDGLFPRAEDIFLNAIRILRKARAVAMNGT